MNPRVFKVIGTSVIVAGLMALVFIAGAMTGERSSADPAPTPTVQVQEDPIATPEPQAPEDQGTYEPLQGQEEAPATSAQLPLPLPSTPEQPAAPAPPANPAPPVPVNKAPYVVSILPANGAIGVDPAANIVVNFSEAMDRASAQAALNLSTGNCGVFVWNSQATQMMLNPCSNWAYGTLVLVNIGTGARDVLGLGLEDDFESSFRVMRRSTSTIYSNADRDGHVYFAGAVTNDTLALIVSRAARGFVSFDLSGLPQNLVEVQAAQVNVHQWDSQVGAYGPSTGNVLIESVTYGALGSGDYYLAPHPLCAQICLGQPPVSKLFSSNPLDGWKSAEMLIAVRNDWKDRAARGYLSQFRLHYEEECSANPCLPSLGISFSASESSNRPFLTITYLHP